ncbi:acetyl-CoA acetyltransferase [Mesorhizobium sp. ASY16-5R]|uniref:acetyl-CoA acetyltransferase n=1 Tax=Mesorhizobium sp. ASY16-5R TaxID=3445772 RepID=UPI003FA13CAF
MTACIVGWAHTPFGKLDQEDIESLMSAVTAGAIADAGIDAADVDEIVVGHFGSGFIPETFLSSMPMQAADALRFKPATRVENACATGSAAIQQAIKSVESGRARIVLVVGAEKMTSIPGREVGPILLSANYLREESDIQSGAAGMFATMASDYFARHGDQSDALARIAAKNHRNGAANPLAHFRKDLGFEFCRTESEKNPVIAGPLKRTDCSAVSDGAAAVIITDVETAMAMPKAIAFRATAHVNDFKPMSKRDFGLLEGCEVAWKQAFARSGGITLDDLSFVETHDCFTIAELVEYEAMGLTARGRGADAINEGWTEKDGRLPVNPSGGLKAKGHPIGATGVSMHVMSSLQLMGEARDMQIPGAELAGIFNMGGAAVTHYVSILQRLR